MQSTPSFIAVAGPMGVGKSVLARIIANQLGAVLVEEAYADNPFLERFYEDGGRERWGMATEVHFLNARYDQCRQIASLLEEGHTVVTDWTPQQNLIFCAQSLTPEEYSTYESLFGRLMSAVPTPDLMILLDAADEVLMKRVQGRGRPMEEDLDPTYLESLSHAYRSWHATSPRALVLDTTHLPIPTSESAQQGVLDQIWMQIGFCPLPGGGRLKDLAKDG